MTSRSDMAVFVTVLKEGSFAAAAKTLQMTPSGVSRRITGLEERLGVRLLNRTTRRLSLTEPGEVYYRRSAQIIADIEETERETALMNAAPRGRLRVTAPNTFGNQELIELMSGFLGDYPDISVELTLTERVVDLVAEGFDVALRPGHLDDSSLIARRLTTTRRVFCAAPAYLEAHGAPSSPADLAGHNCLVHHSQHQLMNQWRFQTEDGEITIPVEGRFLANSIESLYRAALAGVGILRASTFVVDDALKSGRLVPVLEGYSSASDFELFAVYPSNRHLSPKIRAFIDYLSTRLAEAW